MIFCRYVKKKYVNRLSVDAFDFGNYKPILNHKTHTIINNQDEARKKLNDQKSQNLLTWRPIKISAIPHCQAMFSSTHIDAVGQWFTLCLPQVLALSLPQLHVPQPTAQSLLCIHHWSFSLNSRVTRLYPNACRLSPHTTECSQRKNPQSQTTRYPENIMLSELSRLEKEKNRITSLICGI